MVNRTAVNVGIVISLLILIVVLQNTQSVETQFLFARIVMPRALLLLITFLAGCVTGLAVALQIRRGRADRAKAGG